MSQTKTPKERKPKANTAMVNNGIPSHKNASVQKVVKEQTNKQDIKSEHGKQSEKNQPTAEQMRIAQIIDTKSEDPFFIDKLKQVMDATKRSVDDAFTALHDSDNDPNRAVNLLLEGGDKPDEWSTSSKKKKVRSPNEKKEVEKEVPTPAETEDYNNIPANRPSKTSEPSRGSTRNRPFHKAARGKPPIGTSENEKPKPRRAELNGPSRGGKSFRGGRQSGRGGFGRGSRSGFRRSNFETWDQDSDNQTSNNLFNPSVDDEDNEEYTGSLANSQVFTPSTSIEPAAILHGTGATNSFPSSQDQDDSKERLPDRTPISECVTSSVAPSQNLSHFALQQQITLQASPSTINKTSMSIPESILHENKGTAHSHVGDTRSTMSQVSALMSKNEFMYSTVGRGRSLGLMTYSQPSEDVRIQRINPTSTNTAAAVVATAAKAKPRVPPPSKIPSTAVEMPPDADSAIGLLDVQFGALEFGENSSEPVHNSPPSSRPSTPSPQPSDNMVSSGIPASESILSNDSRSFSPSPGTGSNSLTSQIAIETSKIPESTSSSLYQDNVYQTSSSLYTKPTPHSQSIYNQEYNSSHSQRQPGQIITSNNIIYSTSSNTLSTYASSSAGSYGNSSYPNYQYQNYPIISQPSTIPTSSSTNSYQVTVSAQPYSTNSQSVYGSSGLGTSSYNSAYQYNQLNHKTLSSSTPNSKEQFESSTPSVNLNSITHSSSISAANNTLLSSTQATPVSKPSSASTMAAKGAVVASMPPGVPGLVGTHQYIVGQGGVPYFQQPPTMYYEDLQLMPQQRLPHHITTGYYEMGYQPTTTREGVQYNMSDGRFARADNTSPVQVSSMNQQSGTHAQQQPLMNPTAMPPAYAYFYGGSMIPGNFQFGAPLYPVAATGTSTAHGSSSSGVYGKPSNYSGNYSGMYDSNQSNVAEYKSSSTPGPKSQSTAVVNPSTSADIPMMYNKSHSALSKVGSYDKAGFHCPTPPPFNLGSQNSGIAPAGGYPQHLFIPTITPHHNTPLMHQPMHQENTNTVNSRSAINNNPNKNAAKTNYSSSASYWTPN